MKYFIMVKFLKHAKLLICKFVFARYDAMCVFQCKCVN